ncbi:MAG TPA: hypothetical protein VF268_06730 [Gammaproteobacteria bacterium]
MIKINFAVPQNLIAFLRFLFWLASGAAIFYLFVQINLRDGFLEWIGWLLAETVVENGWNEYLADRKVLRLVLHEIPYAVQSVFLGAVLGAVIGYAIRPAASLRAVLIGCLLAFFVWHFSPIFHYNLVYEAIAGSEGSEPIIALLEMRGMNKSEGLKAVGLILSSSVYFMKVNMIMLASLLISAYLFRRIYFSKISVTT